MLLLAGACHREPPPSKEPEPAGAEPVFLESEPQSQPPGPSPSPASRTSEAAKAQARELFREGSEAFRTGDFAEAAAAFESAYALVPMPELMFNAARAYIELGATQPACAALAKTLEGTQPGDSIRDLSIELRKQLAC